LNLNCPSSIVGLCISSMRYGIRVRR
jgi:hypothetical protein